MANRPYYIRENGFFAEYCNALALSTIYWMSLLWRETVLTQMDARGIHIAVVGVLTSARLLSFEALKSAAAAAIGAIARRLCVVSAVIDC